MRNHPFWLVFGIFFFAAALVWFLSRNAEDECRAKNANPVWTGNVYICVTDDGRIVP